MGSQHRAKGGSHWLSPASAQSIVKSPLHVQRYVAPIALNFSLRSLATLPVLALRPDRQPLPIRSVHVPFRYPLFPRRRAQAALQ